MSSNRISGSLPGIFASTYQSTLVNNSMSLNTMGQGSGSLASGVGSNPLNPLQGTSAVSGLNQFVGNLMYTNQMRQLGYLPSSGSSFGNSGMGGMSQLFGSALSGLQSQNPEEQLMGMLYALLGALQGAMSGQGQSPAAGVGFGAPAPGGGFGGAPVGIPMTSGFGGGIPMAGGGAMGGGSIFQQVPGGFAGIDSAINNTLGSIFNTLPLAKL